MASCLDEGVVACLDNNNKDNFDVDIEHSLGDYFGYFSFHTPGIAS